MKRNILDAKEFYTTRGRIEDFAKSSFHILLRSSPLKLTTEGFMKSLKDLKDMRLAKK